MTETCEHPPDERAGQGQLRPDGSGQCEWQCLLCGKQWTETWPATKPPPFSMGTPPSP